MGRAIKKISKAGVGTCGTPRCNRPKAPGRYVCATHAQEMDRIREELETDPRLLYRLRSDNKDRVILDNGKSKKIGKASLPTCCMPGCFELRVPPDIYCDHHMDA
jgi:hypothetical protein